MQRWQRHNNWMYSYTLKELKLLIQIHAISEWPFSFPVLTFHHTLSDRKSSSIFTECTKLWRLIWSSVMHLKWINRTSACCVLNFCTALPYLRLGIHVKDVNVNTWLPDNEVNLVVSGLWPPIGTQGSKTINIGPTTTKRGQNLKLHFPYLWNEVNLVVSGLRPPIGAQGV